jgi:hypothetical protein
MTLLLVAGAGFFGCMGVLVSHESELRCGTDAVCTHVERYPFGLTKTTPLPRLRRADMVLGENSSRRRAYHLALDFADGTHTEYQGVGTNGERAQATARALNDFLEHPTAAQTVHLRDNSMPVAVMLWVLALAALGLLPFFFMKVRLTRTRDQVELVVGRWPARPRRLVVPASQRLGFGLTQRVVNGERLLTVVARVEGQEAGFDLGSSFRSDARAQARLAELEAWRTGP